jgi:glutathione synthase/RimK-type ligase-like ATP-grasp enzyme
MPKAGELKVPEGYGEYAASSLEKQARDLNGMLPQAYWLTRYSDLLLAEVKPRQLALAAQVGFRTPQTLTTNSPAAVRKFAKGLPQMITKSMANTLPVVDGTVRYFYTSKFDVEKADLNGLRLAPAIFQQAIDTVQALRITVVGQDVFAAVLDEEAPTDQPDITDWRRQYNAGGRHFRRFELSDSVRRQCLELTRLMVLDFGAIDILIDVAGNYWFLEINPNGQWAFIEDDTGMPIGEAVAELLDAGGPR